MLAAHPFRIFKCLLMPDHGQICWSENHEVNSSVCAFDLRLFMTSTLFLACCRTAVGQHAGPGRRRRDAQLPFLAGHHDDCDLHGRHGARRVRQ